MLLEAPQPQPEHRGLLVVSHLQQEHKGSQPGLEERTGSQLELEEQTEPAQWARKFAGAGMRWAEGEA